MSQEGQSTSSPRRWNKKRLLALAIIAIAIPSVFAVAILSNILTIGPYNAIVPIAITRVALTDLPTIACPATASMETNYVGAVPLPIASSDITPGLWYKAAIKVDAPHGTQVNVIEWYKIVYTGDATPSSGDISLVYCDQTAPPASRTWITVTTSTHYDSPTKTWTGTITTTGFQLPNPYSSTTPILMLVLQLGTYTSDIWFQTV